MGSILVATIIDRARNTLLETTSVDQRWTRNGELLGHYNVALPCIVLNKPDAGAHDYDYELGPGAKQTLPEGCIQLLDVTHNTGSDGQQTGIAIFQMNHLTLTRTRRDWMTITGSYVEGYVYDPRNPRTWYCYPRPSGAAHVNLVGVKTPDVVDEANIEEATLELDDIYANAIHDFIVGYAFAKNFRAGDLNKHQLWLNKFAQAIGAKTQVQFAINPRDPESGNGQPTPMGAA